MKTINTIIFGLIVFLAGAAFSYVFNKNGAEKDLNHAELFELKRKCATLAKSFIDKKSEEYEHSDIARILWTVLLTDYNVERKSCFGEFNKYVDFPNSPGQNFSEWEIYDLLTGQKIRVFTHSPAQIVPTNRNT